ncbi:acyl-CoA desaturase [Hahella aquimaris]|uniref:acyl-CoA desaturase n=1 Tax=Hahella sp. HNIBRBA332 TaxID=3015983 RepID=UPI00273C1110|nr:acyl-CoA desaturase [Hahella sp. HNIBRBA332]WLQ12756.1 acyl-CoA desaturase [Hahella sp. HNIBRBA332]
MQGLGRLLSWIDNDRKGMSVDVGRDAVDWRRVWPFVGIHLACLAALWVGWSPVAVWVAVAAYLVRMFAITAFYHRYFAHKSFRTSRPVQFIFAVLGASATQRGPLWWAAHHRHHHRTSDTEADPHSPRHGFWRSHAGWFLGGKHFKAPLNLMKDFSQYPELRWLDRFDMCVPLAFGVGMWCLGEGLAHMAPHLQTNGWQMLVWGYFISTVALIHATLAINSLAHRWGARRYETGDDSRNNFILALLTLGEGWHNNHHHYSGSARQGFFWWEFDLSYYLLRLMAALGLIWDLRDVPEHKKWAHKPEVAGMSLNGGRR